MIPPEIEAKVLACANGSYQADLLAGRETWSGSSLAGLARKWGGKYARSRATLVRRINAALPSGWGARTGLVVINARRRRVLLLTSPPDAVNPAGGALVWGVR